MISGETIERIEAAISSFWLSPFCSGNLELGETLLAWALRADKIPSKGFADLYIEETRVAYQVKITLPTSPVTFARLTTESQAELVNSDLASDSEVLGAELLNWVAGRIQEPKEELGATDVRIARVIYTKKGQFTYYERSVDPSRYRPSDFNWRWSYLGNALEGYRDQEKWFSWYPQGRRDAKNQNQLHFSGENILTPPIGSSNRHDFNLGQYAQVDFIDMANAISSLIASR